MKGNIAENVKSMHHLQIWMTIKNKERMCIMWNNCFILWLSSECIECIELMLYRKLSWQLKVQELFWETELKLKIGSNVCTMTWSISTSWRKHQSVFNKAKNSIYRWEFYVIIACNIEEQIKVKFRTMHEIPHTHTKFNTETAS